MTLLSRSSFSLCPGCNVPSRSLWGVSELLPGYQIRHGSGLDRALLVKLMQRTYEELYPHRDFSHLSNTVEQYFSSETPLWWVEESQAGEVAGLLPPRPQPVACLWLGNAIDQVHGGRHAHIFLLYVVPEWRRQGIGSALVQYAIAWAKARGDHQLGLQVFESNEPALQLYRKLGFQVQSLWMIRPLY